MANITDRLRAAIHLESAAIAPQTSPLIEAAKEAEAEIERLRAALNEAADNLELYGDDGTGHTSSGPQSAADKARAAAINQQSTLTEKP